ncbi:hypothetical protein GCM10009816_00490 [Microbacterium aquimaris]|nr:hypothetical protein [Microbacterium aquimaris]
MSAQQAVRGDRSGDLQALRAKLEKVQGRRLGGSALPVHPALAGLLPGGGLRSGSVYSIDTSPSLLFALMSAASRAGTWCAALGMPDLGVEAAERLGVSLSRLVLIPDPGSRWMAVAATVSEVMPIVAVRPTSRIGDADAARFAARLRDRDGVLLVQGRWPQAEATITVSEQSWTGLGAGHGYLTDRGVVVTVSSRRLPSPRRGHLTLPAGDGSVRRVPDPPSTRNGGRPLLEAVG